MPDPNSIGQALAGQAPPQQQAPAPAPPDAQSMPLNTRPGPAPSAPPPQPPQITPQQAQQAKHTAIGAATSFLFGHQTDPSTGQPIKQAPGSIFRSLLAGALLGGTLGAQGATGGKGSSLAAAFRGGAGVLEHDEQQRQQAQEQARKQQAMSLEEQRFKEEQAQHQATMAHWELENIGRAREADFRDRDQLMQENKQDENVQEWAIKNGARLAGINNNDVPGNGPALMKAMTTNPQAFAPPSGYGRLVTKHYSFDGLDHDSKNGWTENGKPVDWSGHLTWSIYYVPQTSADRDQISMTGKEWHDLYGVTFPKDADPNETYNTKQISGLVSVATQHRKAESNDFRTDFKAKHDALQATIGSARTNVTQLESEKRELLKQGYGEDDDEVSAVDEKIQAEQKREQDAINDMHPRIRERVMKPAQPATPAQRTSAPTAGRPAPAHKVGDTVTLRDGRTVTITGINGKSFTYSETKQ